MPDPAIFRLMKQFRAALAKQDEAALRRVIAAYRMMAERLEGRIDALALAAADVTTPAQLIRLSQYQALKRQLEVELRRFGVILESEVSLAARAALVRGDVDSFNLLKYLIPGREIGRVGFGRLPVEAIQTMIGFLQESSPLYTAIKSLAGFHTDEVMRGLLAGIGLGDSPRVTAAKLADLFTQGLGRGLTDSLRITRTAQLNSYREATRANYALNGDVVTGWIWMADIGGDPEPCLSCLAQHGTRHDLDETLDDHQNGRCAMIPEVAGVNPVEDMKTGEGYFNDLSEAKQRELMGPGRFDAWQQGKFNFSDMSHQVEDITWGHVHSVTPLKDLLGESEE